MALRTSDFDYNLPAEYIAQTPVEPRDSSRLLVLNREDGQIQHAVFRDLGNYLHTGDVLIVNETRVIPARIYARKIPGGGKVELLLLRKIDPLRWEVLVGGKGLMTGKKVQVDSDLQAEIQAVLDGPRRLLQFSKPIEPYLAHIGHMPLPPYIHTPLNDPERYQTVYAQQPGSAAAPTAGLHFTPELISNLKQQGIGFVDVTLHVGLDTFAPVTESEPEEHKIHTEWCQITSAAAETINEAHRNKHRVIAVGTTSVRTLESAARQAAPGDLVAPYEGSTDLFILPGYKFHAVDAMITNFHLPKSTLIMLVSAFAGRERILHAYEVAKENSYRFYSFGDSMLIV